MPVLPFLDSVVLEADDPALANDFFAVFGFGDRLAVRAAETPTTGFRGFTLSLLVAQPAIVDAIVVAALDAGATAVKPSTKSFWGYGGVVRAPDGTLLKVATSSKKNTGPATRAIDEIVVLLGTADVVVSKRFYLDHGFAVEKSFGRKFAQFDAPPGSIKLGLYGRRALAKDAGVSPEGTGSHRMLLRCDAGPFTDPDGFRWDASPVGPAVDPERRTSLGS